jgi:hypothetical protein
MAMATARAKASRASISMMVKFFPPFFSPTRMNPGSSSHSSGRTRERRASVISALRAGGPKILDRF